LDAKVSVVIVTYNRCEDLKECLRSIFDLRARPYEVIVVDSSSMDATERLKDCFPIKFVSTGERDRQLARNLGISMASGNVVAFLDDDVVVCREWLTEIAKSYVNESIGGVGGRAIPYATSKFYVKPHRHDIGKVFSYGLVIGNFDIPSESLVEVDSFIGCNMSFRRELLLKVGGFDKNYKGTGYRDDTDLCIRISRLGYKLLYNSKALVWHKFMGKHVGRKWSYWYVRNHVYFYFKNLFIQYRLGFPMFLYYMFMPPRDYILKSGVKVKIEPILILNVLTGLFDGYKMWQEYCTHGT